MYKITGKQRRALKKELHDLRVFESKFWYFHQLDKDCAKFYNAMGCIDTDEVAKQKFIQLKNNIKKIVSDLNEIEEAAH